MVPFSGAKMAPLLPGIVTAAIASTAILLLQDIYFPLLDVGSLLCLR